MTPQQLADEMFDRLQREEFDVVMYVIGNLLFQILMHSGGVHDNPARAKEVVQSVATMVNDWIDEGEADDSDLSQQGHA